MAAHDEPRDVLETVARLLREVMGDMGELGPPIELETSFSEDLELESIEFVALAEKLAEHYGPSADFAAWLSGMDLDQIIALRVGDLVGFLARSRAAAGPASEVRDA